MTPPVNPVSEEEQRSDSAAKHRKSAHLHIITNHTLLVLTFLVRQMAEEQAALEQERLKMEL